MVQLTGLRIELMEVVLKPCGIAQNDWFEPHYGPKLTGPLNDGWLVC